MDTCIQNEPYWYSIYVFSHDLVKMCKGFAVCSKLGYMYTSYWTGKGEHLVHIFTASSMNDKVLWLSPAPSINQDSMAQCNRQ